MRIGLFTECYHPIVNGVVASIDGLAAGLRGLGNETFIFAPAMPGYRRREEGVYRIPSLPLPIDSAYRLTVPVVGPRRGVPVLNTLDVIHANSPFVTGWMAVRYARRRRIPLVYTYHTRLEQYVHYVPFDPNAAVRAAFSLTRRFANLAGAVIAPSAAMADRLREIGVRMPIHVIPSGIDLALFGSGKRRSDLRRSLGALDGERLLFLASRLAREKNVDLVLEAVAQANVPVRFAIAGEGPERRALEERAIALGIGGRTAFLGEVKREDLPDLYASADAFVFPSVTETQGLVLVEALAAGSFIIAAEAPQTRSIVGTAAAVIPPTAAAFAAAIERVPATPDPGRAESAKQLASRFGISAQAARVLGVYDELRLRRLSLDST